jgi:hypothetical protein
MARTGMKFWRDRGFLKSEQSAFQNITIEAINEHRYIQIMIETRQRRFREYYQAHLNDRNTLEGFYKWVMQQYVNRGITNNPNDLLLAGGMDRRDKARTLAFDFFNLYKDRYAIRDTSGKLIKTPRKKARANRRKITGNTSIDQAIRAHQKDITFSEGRLSFEKDPQEITNWKNRIKRNKDKIKQLKQQKNK